MGQLPLLDSTVGIQLLDGADPDQVVREVQGVDVVLGCHPADVDQIGILTRVDPDPVEVLVDQLQGFRI